LTEETGCVVTQQERVLELNLTMLKLCYNKRMSRQLEKGSMFSWRHSVLVVVAVSEWVADEGGRLQQGTTVATASLDVFPDLLTTVRHSTFMVEMIASKVEAIKRYSGSSMIVH
jgi:hypothetical protein